MATKTKTNLNSRELLFVLKSVKLDSKDKTISKKEKDEIYNKLATRYVNELSATSDLSGLKFRLGPIRNITSVQLLQFIIHVLAVLTGYPESSIGRSTKLDDIGVTSLKKETARRRINKYLSDDSASHFITPTEIGRCETVGDLYDLALSKH